MFVRRLQPLLVTLVIALAFQSAIAKNSPTKEKMNSMPLAFAKNMEQWDERVCTSSDNLDKNEQGIIREVQLYEKMH